MAVVHPEGLALRGVYVVGRAGIGEGGDGVDDGEVGEGIEGGMGAQGGTQGGMGRFTELQEV